MRSRLFSLFVLFSVFSFTGLAQRLIGTTGLMNVPTADLPPEGSIKTGVSGFQKAISAPLFHRGNITPHGTFAYYVNFTPFSFLEFTFRETLYKTPLALRKGTFNEQERSTTFRIRPLTERTGSWFPSIVLGANDPHSISSGSPYACWYGVATKHFSLDQAGNVGITAGYFKPFGKGRMYDGIFAGVQYSPLNDERLQISAEYDGRNFNLGIACQLWRRLNLFCYTQEFEGVAIGLNYQHTIKF